ncbi:hypothetical protein EC991_004129 [Linnemannia zychae]|nr:hypothetical protein EC991_004129 [Linnemannia zychae]
MVQPTPIYMPYPVPEQDTTIFPIPAISVAHVRATSDSDVGLSNQRHQRIRNNAPQTSLQKSSSSSSIKEGQQEKIERGQNTVQTAETGTPGSPVVANRNPQTEANLGSNHPQAIPTVAATTAVSTTAAAAAGGHTNNSQPTTIVPVTADSRFQEWGFALQSPILNKPKEQARGAPKQLNIQPRPQAWIDPKDINQAPQETQIRIQNYMERVQSREWHESPLPCLFIVLPKRCLHDDKLTPSWDKFRFFWMCENVEPSPSSPPSASATGVVATMATTVGARKGSLVPHVGHHGGYDLAKPEEFLCKYRAALLLNLQMFKFSAMSNSASNGATIYTQGLASLQWSMNLSKEEIELYLDLMISHLEQMSSEVTVKPISGVGTGAAGGDHQEELPILSNDELSLIRSFLVPTTPTDSGMDELHNQFRIVDEKGHVQWICVHHMKGRLPFQPEVIKKLIGPNGNYTVQEASIEMTDLSNSSALEPFDMFFLISRSGVEELIFDLSKAEWWEKLAYWENVPGRKELWSGINNCRPTSLALTGSKAYPSNMADRSHPLVDLLLKNQQLQCLRIENAYGLLKLFNQDIHLQKFDRLRVLEFTIQRSPWDVECIKQALILLVKSTPGLQKLKLVWEDLSKGGSNSVMVFLRAIASNLRQPLAIDLKTAEEDISIKMQHGSAITFQDAHLQVSSVAIAEKHPMVWQKAVRTLTIKERVNLESEETKTNLTRILGLNAGLTTLNLEYWAVEFQSAEGAIRAIVQDILCGLTKVVLKDSRVDEDDGVADELTVTLNFGKPTSGGENEDIMVAAEARASSHEPLYYKRRKVGVDNSLFYLTYGPSIRNMHLGNNRHPELSQYLDGIIGQGRVDLTCFPIHGYRRIYLTCLAIHGYWDKLGPVLELTRASLKLLAVREKTPLLLSPQNTTTSNKNNKKTASQNSGFTQSRIGELFRGDRLVMIHRNQASDDEVTRVMRPSRAVVTFASDEEAWDKIVSELFKANKL